jgi:hypothetical protein
MNEKPTYRFEIKAKRTGKKIKHFMNKEDFGIYCRKNDLTKMTDDRTKDIALGIVMGLMNDKEVYVEVYKLNEQGGYDLIRAQF